MGATFSRIKTWITGEKLYASDLNAEINNILTNLMPSGIDDESSTAAVMQATTDPYPGSVASLATSLQGEIQRIRYMIAQITGKTYWYQDPDTTLAIVGTPVIPAGTKAWFYQNVAPTGWVLDETPADALLSVKGGANAYNTTGGTQAGTWTQPNHTHGAGSLSGSSHTHDVTIPTDGWSGGTTDGQADQLETCIPGVDGGSNIAASRTFTSGAASTGAISGSTDNGATAATWRPLAQVGIICTKS